MGKHEMEEHMKKVILFGARLDGKELLMKLNPFVWMNEIEVLGFIDNDAELWGKESFGYPVDNPVNILKYDFDLVIITPIFHQMMREQLLSLSVPNEKIKTQYSLPFIGSESRHFDCNNVTIGRYSYFKGHCLLRNCRIGNFVCMGDFVNIGLVSHDIRYVSSYPFHIRFLRDYRVDRSVQPTKMTILGNDIYLGEGCVINQGVEIGHGAVVAAHAVVTKDVPAYAIAGGIPAKIIKYRFSLEIIEKLLKIAWWDWNDDKIQENVEFFYRPVEEFVSRFYLE